MLRLLGSVSRVSALVVVGMAISLSVVVVGLVVLGSSVVATGEYDVWTDLSFSGISLVMVLLDRLVLSRLSWSVASCSCFVSVLLFSGWFAALELSPSVSWSYSCFLLELLVSFSW